jgi:hypothetical protein
MYVHNESLLYGSSQNIFLAIKSRRWAGNVTRMGERSGAYRALVGSPEGKKPLERPRLKWEDNTEMNLEEIECGRGLD